MIQFEIKKFLSKFNIIFVSVMLFLNIAVAFIPNADALSEEAIAIKEAKKTLIEEYNSDKDQYLTDYTQYLSQKESNEYALRQSIASNSDITTHTLPNQRIDLINYGDMELYADVESIVNNANNYNDDIKKIIYKAYSIIKDVGSHDGLYAYEYQVGIISHYEKLLNLQLTPSLVSGWNEFFENQTSSILLFATFIAFFSGIYSIERKVKITPILHITKNGGYRLRISKSVSVFIFAIVLTLIFTLSPLLVLKFTTGLSAIDTPIQTIDIYRFCPYSLTISEFLIAYIFCKILFFLTFAFIIVLLDQLFHQDSIKVGISTLILILNYILFTREINSTTKYNLFSLSFVTPLFERYKAENILGCHLSYICLLAFILLIVSTLVITFSLLFNPFSKRKNRHPKIKQNQCPHSILIITPKSFSVFSFEFSKILADKKNLIVLVVLLISKIVFSFVYFTPTQNSEQYIYYINKIYGEFTAEKEQYIIDESKYVADAINNFNLIQTQYRHGEVDLSEYREALYINNYAISVSEPLDRIKERSTYLSNITNDYNNIWFILDEGIIKYVSLLDIFLVLSLIFINGHFFPFEYDSGFISILKVSRKGRHETQRAKYTLAIVMTSLFFVIFSLIDLFFLFHYYDLSCLKAGVMSIPFLSSVELDISISHYLITYKIISYVGYITLSILSLAITDIVKEFLKPAISLILAIIIPYCMSLLGINVFRFINITLLLSPTFVNKHFFTYFLSIILAICIYHLSCKKWRDIT